MREQAMRRSGADGDICPADADGAIRPSDAERAERDALGPVEAGSPVVTVHDKAAGGLEAVTSALRYAIEQAGIQRGTRSLLRLNQKRGFDCPGCAWPDPEHRAVAEFCENGARAVADEATTQRADPTLFEDWSIEDLAAQSDQWLNARGRLTEPMLVRRGAGETHYHAVSWTEAFEIVARELRALPNPDHAAFYTSGRASNEAAFLYQLFVRSFGTNNLPDCSNLCHESSGAGMKATVGVGKGTVLLEDFDQAEAIFVIGQNPGTNHPRMLSALRSAKQRGCKIVAINPLREAALLKFAHPQKIGDLLRPVDMNDLYLQVRVGGDVALLKGIAKALFARDDAAPGTVIDHAFITSHTVGFEAFRRDVEQAEWADLVSVSGISRDAIERAAEIAARSKATIVCWAMGITQHKNGVANVQSIVNLLLMQGNLGKPGAGPCPVRGHSNVQGDRTVGISEWLPKWFPRLAEALGCPAPQATGYGSVETLEAMHEGHVRALVALGGNFLSANPDTRYTARALSRCRLTVHIATKLNRAHLVPGEIGLILPCLGRTERDLQDGLQQFVSVENSMGIVHRSEGSLSPASDHLLSEPRIVAQLAHATLAGTTKIDWLGLAGNYDRIRDLIATYIPGFENYNERVRASGGFLLPNSARDRRFDTPSGKAHFTVHPLPNLDLAPGQLWLTTVRAHDQFNTTIYAHDDRYRGIHDHRRVIMMNPSDIERLGLHAGERVEITSHFEGTERRAPSFSIVPYDIPEGSAAAYFPEANVLVPWNSYADISKTPTSKRIAISLRSETSDYD